jgi:hypothetical protein
VDGASKAGGTKQPDERSLTGNDDPSVPGGTEQPKNDRRKRGDLGKRTVR